jgi:hypothetical protein
MEGTAGFHRWSEYQKSRPSQCLCSSSQEIPLRYVLALHPIAQGHCHQRLHHLRLDDLEEQGDPPPMRTPHPAVAPSHNHKAELSTLQFWTHWRDKCIRTPSLCTSSIQAVCDRNAPYIWHKRYKTEIEWLYRPFESGSSTRVSSAWTLKRHTVSKDLEIARAHVRLSKGLLHWAHRSTDWTSPECISELSVASHGSLCVRNG